MKNEKKQKGFKLMAKLIIMVSVPMLLLLVVALFALQAACVSVADAMVQHELNAVQYAFDSSISNIASGNFINRSGNLFKGTYNITADTEFFDNFSNEVDLDVSVIFDNTQLATSLVDEEGNRMVGIEVSDEIYQTVVVNHEQYFSDNIMLDGKEYFGLYSPLTQNYDGEEVIGMTFIGLESSMVYPIYMQVMLKALMGILVVFVVSIAVTAIYLVAILKNMTGVIGKLDSVAKGSLNTELSEKLMNRGDEIGDMARSVHGLITNLVDIISNLLNTSKNLDALSEEFKDSFTQMSDYISNVDRAVEEMAEGATNQAGETQNVSMEVSQMGDAIAITSENVDRLSGNTDKMREYNTTVESTLEELIKIGIQTREAFDVVYEQTNNTNKSVQEIQTAADMITNIADQTSLLSLNASIEAARAGEHGKGFAVVAGEIRQLADQSAESANQITNILSTLIKNSNTTVETVKQVNTVMERQDAGLKETKEVFDSLNKEVNEVSDAVGGIKEKVDELANIKDTVLGAMDNLSAIAQENAASTEETSASMQELRGVVNDCNTQVGDIVKMSEELAQNTNRFEIGKEKLMENPLENPLENSQD